MSATIVSTPTSPFRPPKFPIRSLPKPVRVASPKHFNGTLSAAAGAGGNVTRFSPTSLGAGPIPGAGGSNPSTPVAPHAAPMPLAPSPIHSTPPSSPLQPPPIGYMDPRNGRPLIPGNVGLNSNPLVAGMGSKPIPMVPMSKALPIINRQTGQPVLPIPLNPGALAPLEPQQPLTVGGVKGGAPSPLTVEAPTPILPTPTKAAPPQQPPAVVEPPVFRISEASIEQRTYTSEEMRSLRQCITAIPDSLLQLIVSGELFPGIASTVRLPAHLMPNKDSKEGSSTEEPSGFQRDVFGAAASTTLENAVAVRLRQVKETHQKVMSVLSRLTPEKYDALKKELMDLPLRQTDEKQLKQVVTVFFEKAVQEPVYSELYASLVSNMCHVSDVERALPKEEKDKLFPFRMRRELLNKCQEEFTKPMATSQEELASLSESELSELRSKYKKRLCGNIKFVCELYSRSLVTDRVIDSILNTLVSQESTEDYIAEALATTMNSAGSIFSKSQPEAFDRHMKYCQSLQKTHPSRRIQFLMMDLEDNRKRGFEKRKQVLTQDEFDRQQFEDQRKLQEELDRALRDQKRGQQRGTTTTSTTTSASGSKSVTVSSGPKIIATKDGNFPTMAERVSSGVSSQQNSAPQSPVTPSRPPKPRSAMQAPTGTSTLGSRVEVPPNASANSLSSQGNGLLSPSQSSSTPLFGYRDPTAGASSTSLSSMGPYTPTSPSPSNGAPRGAPLTKDQVERTASDMMTHFAIEKDPNKVLERLLADFPERSQRSQILIGWLRRSVATTKLFTEREMLPSLFHALLQNARDATAADSTVVPVLTLPELAKMMNEWIISDIDCQQYDNCPRMFSNWAKVVDGASKFTRDADSTDPSILLQPATLNLFLEERRVHNDTVDTEHFVKELLVDLDSATEENLQKVCRLVAAGQPVQDIMLPLLQRFRMSSHVAHVQLVEGGGDDLLGKLLQNAKLKDDAELIALKTCLHSEPDRIQEELRNNVSGNSSRNAQSSAVSPLHRLMKVMSSVFAVLIPYHGATIERNDNSNPFANATLISADRANALTTAARVVFQHAVGLVSEAFGKAKGEGSVAHSLCSLVTLSELTHNVAFAVSANTEHSVPASPVAPHTPTIPLPRTASTASISTALQAQLDFEENFTVQLTSRLNQIFATSASATATQLTISEPIRTGFCQAVQGSSIDYWFVSAPSSLRTPGPAGTISLQPSHLTPTKDGELTALSSSEDMTNTPLANRSRNSPIHTPSMLHTRTIANSVAVGFTPVLAQ